MKKQLLKSALIAVAGVGLLAGSAMALPNGGSSASLNTIFKSLATDHNNDVSADNYLNDSIDSTWAIAGSGQSVATLIIELAGYADTNIFGIYDLTTNGTLSYVQLFGGVANGSDTATVSIYDDGTVMVTYIDKETNSVSGQYYSAAGFTGNSFGYYLDSRALVDGVATKTDGGLFYSDSDRNSDSKDHMLAYQGIGEQIKIPGYQAGDWSSSEYILAFEDLINGHADWDYDDFVVMVESVSPIPEPATMLLFGTGLAGLAGVARRKKANN